MDHSKKRESEEWNDWAFDGQKKAIHVSQAASGRGDYYCMGCGAVMQAMISKTNNRISFFRHDPGEIEKRKSCGFGSESYRHKLGKEILQRIKRIKVPRVYKYPPRGVDGLKYKLADSGFVFAENVEVELTFFQTENGEIRHGKGSGVPMDERFHIIRPDVTFFNTNNEPILLIELVATHKVDNNKKAKLNSLGINIIQVKLPPKDAEGLELSFLKTEYTKWIYNELESRTDYFQLSGRSGERIQQPDELERDLFEENFKCRSAQIGKLIRSIERCLGTEYYQGFEERLRSGISSVAEAKRRTESELGALRAEIEERVNSEFREAENAIRQGDKEQSKRYFELEQRYHQKREELEQQERQVGREQEEIRDEEYSFDLRTNSSSKEYREIIENVCVDIRKGRRIIQEERDKIRGFENSESEFQRKENELANEISNEEREYTERTRIWTQRDEETERGFIEAIRKQIRDFESIAQRKEEELESEIRGDFERKIEKIQSGDIDEFSGLPRNFKEDISGARIITDYLDAQEQLKRIRAAEEYFEQKTWKSWHK